MTSREGVLSRRYLPASVAIYTVIALVAFEGTAVAAALPQVAADLGGLQLLPWVVTAFLFASGVATVVAGPLIDMVGTRTVFRWAVGIFTLGGVAAAAVPNMPALIAARLVHGAGGGLVVAVGLAAVSLVYPARLTGRAFAANATVWGVMGAAAPAIAAVMLTALSWRWIFLVTLPLGVLSLVAGWRVMPGPTEGAETSRVDVVGAGLIALFTLASLLAVDRLNPTSLAWLGLAGLAVAGYRLHAARTERPVLRPAHLVGQPYLALGLMVGLILAATFAANIYVTLYVSAGRGVGPALTAWSVFFFTVGWTLGANVSSRLLDWKAETTVMMIGLGFTVPGLAVAWVGSLASSPLAVIYAGLLSAGVGVGLSTNAALTLLRAVTPPEQIGRASAAHQFVRNQGFTLGTALGGAVMLLVISRRLGTVEPVRRLLAGESVDVAETVSRAVESGFAVTTGVATVLCAAAVFPAAMLRRQLRAARLAKRGRSVVSVPEHDSHPGRGGSHLGH